MDVQTRHGVVGMSLETYYKNSVNREDAEKGNTCAVIAYAKTRAEITKAHSDVFNQLPEKTLPDYNADVVDPNNYITSYVSGYYGTKKQVDELAGKCNSLINAYNDILATAKNEQTALHDARGKLMSFNESAGKDAILFDKKLMKQFRLDAQFDSLVEEFKKMRLISEEDAKKAETPVDWLKLIYEKHEEQQKANEATQGQLTKKNKTLASINYKYGEYIGKIDEQLEATKQTLSQYQHQNKLLHNQHSEISNTVKKKEKELLNIQKLLDEKDRELKQHTKVVDNLTEDKSSLKDELAKEKINLAQSNKNAARVSEKLTNKIRALESQAQQLSEEKIQLEHELSQLKDRHKKLTEAQNTNKNLAQSVAVSGSEIKKLETALEVKDQELLRLKIDLSKLTNRVEQQEIKFSEEQLKQKETIQDYENKLKIVNDELSAKKEELKENDKDMSRLLKNYSKQEQSLQDKQNKVSDLEIKLVYHTKEIAKLKVQEKDLKSKLDTANNEINSFKKMMANKKIEVDEIKVKHDFAVKSLENSLANKKEEVSKKDVEIKTLRKEVSHLKNKVEASGNKSVKIDELISQKEDAIIRLGEELQSAYQQINDLGEKINTANSEKELYKQKSSMASQALRSHNIDTSKNMSELKSSLSDLRGEVAEKGREIEELQSQYANAQELIKTLQQQNGELATELAKYDTDRLESQIQVTESSEESQQLLEKMGSEITNLNMQLESAYAQLQEFINREQQSFNEYPSLSPQQKSLKKENEELINMYREASDQQFQLEERVVELEHELKVANQKLLETARTQDDGAPDAEFELAKANRAITKLNQQISQMEREHKKAIRDLDELLSEEAKKAVEAEFKTFQNATAVDDVKDLENEKKRLQNSLTGLCNDLKGLISEEKYDHLTQKHFGQYEQNAELVEEHLVRV
ncbi:coiled-coil domain-containing protein [Endozoicomonas euniceicola]|uniref:Chromosome segregation ATPase n=1 Tax=Endozoicomonas euniceicola TaxID=1234143 RepID=A0ABY6H295_9GAMM|nr:hypothetical protein [Endozoicomonas euniceicola]UYM18744.1 hypothetical protein NX720_12835 [Endozoicomonas euniceicola]